ncbi:MULTISPECIES: hypothetical protein [Bradyrhizobium]|uniref:hypothetical protein n=1 Tax=Bradyrhizobium TaxID=374 RepID=UPI0004006C63|nr:MULTISPECIES: hypothetical protein [Bradyrhizobium]RZN30274.1 hypothetical protein CWO90_21150 [Bradyrhizobium sp. Leo121]
MVISLAERAEELRAERRVLLKADGDIEEGLKRLQNQQDLLLDLQAAGHDTTQAERLVVLLEQTLLQWEHHRTLIEQRIAYLENEIYPLSIKGT